MVFDKPRLPGVLDAGGSSRGFIQLPEGDGSCAPSGPEEIIFVAIQPTRGERSRCATPGLDPERIPPACRYPDPRSGTDLLAAACPGRRLAA